MLAAVPYSYIMQYIHVSASFSSANGQKGVFFTSEVSTHTVARAAEANRLNYQCALALMLATVPKTSQMRPKTKVANVHMYVHISATFSALNQS